MSGEDREQLIEGTLISHRVELRQRLLKAVIAVAVRTNVRSGVMGAGIIPSITKIKDCSDGG